MGRKSNKRSGCLGKIVFAFVFMILLSIIMPSVRDDENNTTQPAKETAKATSTIKVTAQRTATPTAKPTSTPNPTATPTEIPTATPTATPAVPGTFRPGIEGTNAYDIIGALKTLGIDTPRRQTVNDGYYWWSGNLTEGNVDYNIEIETDRSYRVTTMQIMMHGGNNNFVWWACACMFGENSERVAWLKDNMWNNTTTTKTFVDDVWIITPMEEGVFLTIQHVDADAWYMSQI